MAEYRDGMYYNIYIDVINVVNINILVKNGAKKK